MNKVRFAAILAILVANVALIRVLGQSEANANVTRLAISADKQELGPGETATLKVIGTYADGSVADVTAASTQTRYTTTDEGMLVPEGDGKITCTGTNQKPFESAIISAINHLARSSISITLRSTGPGPTLDINPEKTTLREGEKIRFQVVTRADKLDLTSQSSGTRYLIFKGYGVPDDSVLEIDSENEAMSALMDLGRYQQLHPVIFVRNGDLVGWTELRIVHKNSIAH